MSVSTETSFVSIDLSDDERGVLLDGLREWGGPARCTDEMALAMGFGTVEELRASSARLSDQLSKGVAITRSDWHRMLLATEIVFASDVVGSGVDWETTTGRTDEDTIRVLRSLQRKIVGA